MSTLAAIHHPSHTVSSKPPAVFEFTKRKKWADILISELSGSVLVVLNKDSNVLWASPAITELLGWREDEITERSIREFLHDDDAASFAEHLKRATDSRSELFTYVRIKSKFTSPHGSSHPSSPHSPTGGPSNPPSPTLSSSLFELRGHAIYSKTTSTSDPGPSGSSSSLGESSADPDASCFIIMARPYPSRNTAMLDSFLELKIENERLRQQLFNLKTSGGASSPTMPSPAFPISQIAPPTDSPHGQPSALSSPVYPTSNMSGLNLAGANASGDADAAYQPHSIHAMPQPPSAYYTPQGNRYASGTFDGMYPPSTFGAGPGPAALSARRGSIVEETQGEPSERTRKKPKKAHTVQEQYVCVTCGRTDSPEWRKGPLGAKTLCNACGLRWAKRNSKRKTDDLAGAEGGG